MRKVTALSLLSHLLYLMLLIFFCLLNFLIIVPPPFATSQAPDSTNMIRLGSSISTSQPNPSWSSPSGEFAFGFYRLSDANLFFLAIWFAKTPNKTIVWSAHTGPLKVGSKVELTNNGRLILFDHQNNQILSRPQVGISATSASMLNNGNFVLNSAPKNTQIWATFDEPTDTILPEQSLKRGRWLSSHQSQSDFTAGKFQLHLKDNGELALYTVNVPTGYVYTHDSLDIFKINLGNGSQLSFYFTNLVLEQSDGTRINITRGDSYPIKDFYHRATLDFDGVLRHYVLPKQYQNSTRPAAYWRVISWAPSDVCMGLTAYMGSGVCGYNSICRPKNESGKYACVCPPHYIYLNPNNPLQGCKNNFTSQSYGSITIDGFEREKPLFKMEELPKTNWSYTSFERYEEVNENKCSSLCLEDCFCAVAIFDNNTCLKKKLPLSNGKSDNSITAKAFLKVPNGKLLTEPSKDVCKKQNKAQARLLSLGWKLLSSSLFLNFLLVSTITWAFCCSSYHKRLFVRIHDQDLSSSHLLALNLRSFTFEELDLATNRFKEELGRGAFGGVYKGVLTSDSNLIIAVKRLDKVVQEGEREFKTEVTVIGQTHHRNLVKLLGFCDKGSHRLLVYEFMSNGSLASLLFASKRPGWGQRQQIAAEIARGISYLHEQCRTQIVHCDIKPENILLDDCLVARISDFGLAKLMKADQARSTTGIKGTPGYLAPEWYKNLPISGKVDVYSFGVMLLEIVSCRRHNQMESEEQVMVEWVYKCYREGNVARLVEGDEEAMRDLKTVERMVKVGLWCVQEDPAMRPSMRKVVRMLAGVLDVSVPLDPNTTRYFSQFI